MLRVATLDVPQTLHPYPQAHELTNALAQALTLTSASLISMDWNTLEWTANPQFDLAREMPTKSSDGRTYTFKLREPAGA